MTRRRAFDTNSGRAALTVTLILGLVAAPIVGEAQQTGKAYRIGVLEATPAALNAANLDAFRQGMRDLGYMERQNYVIEYRSADGRSARFAELAVELVLVKVDLILTRGTSAVIAAKNATRTIPIVMAASGDPVGTGVVASLARPGGNVTGLSALTSEVSGKRLQLVKEVIPRIGRIAALLDVGNPAGATEWQEIELAARSIGLQPQLLDVRKAEDLERAFDAAIKQRADAVIVGLSSLAQRNVGRIVDLSSNRRLPAIYLSREFVDAGGLMAYGVSYPDLYRRAAAYVDKILNGVKPGDLSVEQAIKFDLAINLKTAKALGLTMPPSVLLQADWVIE